MNVQIEVLRNDFSDVFVRETPHADLPAGAVRFAIDAFGLTANNVTYAAVGETMHYWRFFPAAEPGRGCVPVWGFGVASASTVPGISIGERFWGFWPMASAVDLVPGNADAGGFSDAAPHRASLHPVYNRYLRCTADPAYDDELEAEQMLLRPLFATAWLIDDYLAEKATFGAGRVLLSSASSKTALALAWLLARRPGVEVVGLTSDANRGFVERTGCFDAVIAYDALGLLDAEAPVAYVDFSGDAALRRAIHARFRALAWSGAVGLTHWQAFGGADKALPGPRPELFFAPAQAKKRTADLGAQALAERMAASMRTFFAAVRHPENPWFEIERRHGADAVTQAWRTLVAGRTAPETGLILSLA